MAKGRNGEKKDVQFVQRFKKAERSAAVSALACMQRAASEGKWQAAAWLLERRYGYIKRKEVEDDTLYLQELNRKELLAQLEKSDKERRRFLGPNIVDESLEGLC